MDEGLGPPYILMILCPSLMSLQLQYFESQRYDPGYLLSGRRHTAKNINVRMAFHFIEKDDGVRVASYGLPSDLLPHIQHILRRSN